MSKNEIDDKEIDVVLEKSNTERTVPIVFLTPCELKVIFPDVNGHRKFCGKLFGDYQNNPYLCGIYLTNIDNVHPSNNEPKERERIIDEYLRYFSMNLSAVGFDNVIKEMINKHNSTFACFTFSTLIYTFFR